MDVKYAISLVLNAHLPFVKGFTAPPRRQAPPEEILSDPNETEDAVREAEVPQNNVTQLPETAEESWFFETLSETYLPLLEVFDHLEKDTVPFRIGLSISPVFAQMLNDEILLKKYAVYLDHQVDFGLQELERVRDNPAMHRLAERYYKQIIENRAAFITRYDRNIIKAFDYYRRKKRIEFLATTATQTFLPFLCPYPEAVQAQIEVALSYYRYSLGISPQGFWLPDMGWTKELDLFLRSYGFGYTITESHGFVFGNPPPSRGTFFPVKTPQGLFILARDFYASADINIMQKAGACRDNNRDIGYELPVEKLGPFLSQNGARLSTGFKYWNMEGENHNNLYDYVAAQAAAGEHARAFLENRCKQLNNAVKFMQEQPLCLCAFNADNFGRFWHEGPQFLEALFRQAADYGEILFVNPSEYLGLQTGSSIETSVPEFSSWGENGYAEVWLDSSNDWVYRHLHRSIKRMVELADRFSENSSLKERALNQAAREILLALASDWPAFLYRQEFTEFARYQVQSALQNFTTIYEALGSSHISTEWLTSLERQHNIFPNINYRVFRRKC